jgi:hypothetical protein
VLFFAWGNKDPCVNFYSQASGLEFNPFNNVKQLFMAVPDPQTVLLMSLLFNCAVNSREEVEYHDN